MSKQLPQGHENQWDPKKGYISGNYEPKILNNTLFNIGQGYDNKTCDQYVCGQCGNDSFYVGCSSYYTAIKCTKCDYETCVHEG